MKNLISMTDFVLEQELQLRNESDYDNRDALVKIFNYANFLKQPLELWMFVPCDQDGNVLEEPTEKDEFRYCNGIEYYPHQKKEYAKEYQKAKKRCLFEGFKFLEKNLKVFHVENKKEVFGVGYKNGIFKTIEDLVKYNLQLTKTAIKW